jgi:hypothetical protein
VRDRALTRVPWMWIAAIALLCVSPVSAQTLARFSLDSVSAVDLFKGEGTTGHPDASLDVSSVIRITDRWSVHLRPWLFHSAAANAGWNKEIYDASIRYVRPGTTSLRVDAGYMASPIGLGMLDMRADINPTIQPHLSYFIPMLPFERGAPTNGAIAASYPLGIVGAASSGRWDARVALVNTAPTRKYVLSTDGGNPKQTPVWILGGGITPRTGMRLGASMAAGRYATARELADPTGPDRKLRMWTAEGEYAFGYTKLAAEYTRERFARGPRSDTAATWFAQVMQTLTPRWFAAARHETMDAPPPVFAGPSGPRVSFRTTEATIGYRLTPELIVRGSVTASRYYTATTVDRRAGVQLVWARRWW